MVQRSRLQVGAQVEFPLHAVSDASHQSRVITPGRRADSHRESA